MQIADYQQMLVLWFLRSLPVSLWLEMAHSVPSVPEPVEGVEGPKDKVEGWTKGLSVVERSRNHQSQRSYMIIKKFYFYLFGQSDSHRI